MKNPRTMRTRAFSGFAGRLLVTAVALGLAVVGTAARAETVAAAPARATVAALPAGAAEADIDGFWRKTLEDAGVTYTSPGEAGFADVFETAGCGTVAPQDWVTFFCATDDTVYYSVPSVAAEYERFGDAGWINMMAHEWGHHVQLMLGIIGPDMSGDGVAIELQATCFGGLYVHAAKKRGLIDTGAVHIMQGMFVGDPEHGSQDDLRQAFDRGFHGSLKDCGATV